MTALFLFGGLSIFCTAPGGGSITGRSRKLSAIMLALDFDVKLMLLLSSLVMINVKDER